MRVAPEIKLTSRERTTLHRWSRGRRVSVRQAERAKMILQAAAGRSNLQIATELDVKAHTVAKYQPGEEDHKNGSPAN